MRKPQAGHIIIISTQNGTTHSYAVVQPGNVLSGTTWLGKATRFPTAGAAENARQQLQAAIPARFVTRVHQVTA
jgi:hypothetical protein